VGGLGWKKTLLICAISDLSEDPPMKEECFSDFRDDTDK
jgi:hypothetical protein